MSDWFLAGVGLGVLAIAAGYVLLWVLVLLSALFHLVTGRFNDPDL